METDTHCLVISRPPDKKDYRGSALMLGQMWASCWQAWLARQRCRRTVTLLSHLDEHLLQDIGAPAWAIQEVATARLTEQYRREQWLRR